MYGIVGICVPESVVFSSKDPTCCDLLRAFAHIAQQETTMLVQQCCVLLRAFARALRVADCRNSPSFGGIIFLPVLFYPYSHIMWKYADVRIIIST